MLLSTAAIEDDGEHHMVHICHMMLYANASLSPKIFLQDQILKKNIKSGRQVMNSHFNLHIHLFHLQLI